MGCSGRLQSEGLPQWPRHIAVLGVRPCDAADRLERSPPRLALEVVKASLGGLVRRGGAPSARGAASHAPEGPESQPRAFASGSVGPRGCEPRAALHVPAACRRGTQPVVAKDAARFTAVQSVADAMCLALPAPRSGQRQDQKPDHAPSGWTHPRRNASCSACPNSSAGHAWSRAVERCGRRRSTTAMYVAAGVGYHHFPPPSLPLMVPSFAFVLFWSMVRRHAQPSRWCSLHAVGRCRAGESLQPPFSLSGEQS